MMDKVVSRLVFGLIAAVTAGFVTPAESQVPQQMQEKSNLQSGPAQVRIFKHPKFGYTLSVPPGVDIQERQDGSGKITIRARKGYTISVQAGTSRHEIPLNQLSRFIEAKFMGPGKPWRQRVTERKTVISGLPAHEINYEGPNNRSKVLFVRGNKLDYIFIYIAAHREFSRYIHEYDWLLENFSPAKSEIPDNQDQFKTRANKFSKPGYGYSMLYPEDWEQSPQRNMTMMFSGRQGTPAFTSIVSIQNIDPPNDISNTSRSGDTLIWTVHDLKSNLGRSVPNVKFSVDQPWTYNRSGIELVGRELNASYMHAGQKFRKVIFVIPRPNQDVVHIWSYTAPEQDFSTYQPLVEQMLKSWTILDPSRQ